MTTFTAAPVKAITYDRHTGDYKMELDGEFVGYAACYHAAEVELDRLAFEHLNRAGIEPEMLQSATALDGGSSVEEIAADCISTLEALRPLTIRAVSTDSLFAALADEPTPAPTRTITIPSCDQHGGHSFNTVTLTLKWICPACGGPRGEPYLTCSYDGSRRLAGIHGWRNPCGHVDYYGDVRAEIAELLVDPYGNCPQCNRPIGQRIFDPQTGICLNCRSSPDPAECPSPTDPTVPLDLPTRHNCGGAHHIQRCGELRAALLTEPDDAPADEQGDPADEDVYAPVPVSRPGGTCFVLPDGTLVEAVIIYINGISREVSSDQVAGALALTSVHARLQSEVTR